MLRTGEIQYPEWTKTSTAARQFDVHLSRARGRKHLRNAKNQTPSLGNMTEIDDSS